MAIWRSSLRQTAANDAASIVVAELTAGILSSQDEVDTRFTELVENIFADLDEVAKQDDAQYEGSSDKPAKRGRKTGGGSKSKGRRSGGGKSSITLEDALAMELTSGVFEGETLGTVLDLSAEDADEDYGYADGERSGADYIAWLASDKNKNDYTQRRARIIAEAEGLDF